MRLIFMGTPEFSCPTLKALATSSHEVVAVYCQPPRPSGRGYQLSKSPIHTLAESLQIPVYTPLHFKSSDDIDIFKNHRADLAIVVAYGLLLPRPILDAPIQGCFNIHASLLPRWRGAAPIHRAILAGDTQTGITIMRMDTGLDTGPMLHTISCPITKETTYQSLHNTLAVMGSQAIIEVLGRLEKRTLQATLQPDHGITYAQKIKKSESQINWNDSAQQIHRHIRAFYPWPGAWTAYKNTRLKILSGTIVPYDRSASPGTILEGNLIIACGKEALKIEKIQKPGGRPLDTQEFLKGFALSPGEILTPFNFPESNK